MATLVHDDLIDGAKVDAARRPHGLPTAPAAPAPPATTSSRGPSPRLAADGDLDAVATLAEACLSLARGEAMQRRQLHDPGTTVEAYLERCSLKTGKLFEAACSLGSGGTLGRFGLNLGIAFQIADDILDCSGDTIETGKVAGTDLREGDADAAAAARGAGGRRRPVALAGGPLEGALLRVAATGAIERSSSRARLRLAGRGQASRAASIGRSSSRSQTLSSIGGA